MAAQLLSRVGPKPDRAWPYRGIGGAAYAHPPHPGVLTKTRRSGGSRRRVVVATVVSGPNVRAWLARVCCQHEAEGQRPDWLVRCCDRRAIPGTRCAVCCQYTDCVGGWWRIAWHGFAERPSLRGSWSLGRRALAVPDTVCDLRVRDSQGGIQPGPCPLRRPRPTGGPNPRAWRQPTIGAWAQLIMEHTKEGWIDDHSGFSPGRPRDRPSRTT